MKVKKRKEKPKETQHLLSSSGSIFFTNQLLVLISISLMVAKRNKAKKGEQKGAEERQKSREARISPCICPWPLRLAETKWGAKT